MALLVRNSWALAQSGSTIRSRRSGRSSPPTKLGADPPRTVPSRRGAAISGRLTGGDLWLWERMTDALAATRPGSNPALAHHRNSFGHRGEIVRRARPDARRRLRAMTEPLGPTCAGLSAAEQARCADVIWVPSVALDAIDPFAIEGDGRLPALSYFNPPGYSSTGVVNSPEWRAAQVPATNGHGSAVGLARLYAAIIEPDGLLSPGLLAQATRVQSEGPCPILGEDVSFGLGFVPTSARRPLGTSRRSFGHFGTGGALGFGDPDAGLAFGYVMNHVVPRWQSTRNRALIDAVYASL